MRRLPRDSGHGRRWSVKRRVRAWWAAFAQDRRRARALRAVLTETGAFLLAEDGMVIQPEGEG